MSNEMFLVISGENNNWREPVGDGLFSMIPVIRVLLRSKTIENTFVVCITVSMSRLPEMDIINSAGHHKQGGNPVLCRRTLLERNNVVVLFGTLKVQSFILTEVSDCGLLFFVTYSIFQKRKDMLKKKSSYSRISSRL